MKHPLLAAVSIAVGLAGAIYSTVSYRTSKIAKAFVAATINDSVSSTIKRIGEPDVIEGTEKPFLVYADTGCVAPCKTRLWWEHPVLKGFEAWSITVGDDGQILEKAHWVSP